jgi:hypothetical protein
MGAKICGKGRFNHVMAGLVPAIHDFALLMPFKIVDGRDKPGDDGKGRWCRLDRRFVGAVRPWPATT